MDVLEDTYASKMKLFKDAPGVLVDGQWHLCPPGAVPYPGWHAFGSQDFDPNQFTGDAPAIGEQPGKRGPIVSPATPGYAGKQPCGSPDVWAHGDLVVNQGSLPVDARGRPLCCAAVDRGASRVDGTGFSLPTRAWFLRDDVPPLPPILPAGLLLGWVNIGTPANPAALVGVQGNTTGQTTVHGSGPSNCPAGAFGVAQFVSGPMSQLALPAQKIGMSCGYSRGTTLNNATALAIGVAVVNGTNGTLKQDLTGILGFTQLIAGPSPELGRIRFATTAPVTISNGDYLCVELGYAIIRTGTPACVFNATWYWGGTDRVRVDLLQMSSVAAMLTMQDA